MNNPDDNGDNCEQENELNFALDNGREVSEAPDQRNLSAVQNVPGLIRPIQLLRKKADKASRIVNITVTRRNQQIKTL